MKPIWHIVEKDVRRLRLPLAVWLASIASVAAAMRFMPTSRDLWPFSDLTVWMEIVGAVSAIVVWSQVVVGGILAGVIVLEDPAAGTTMFWRTRPISAGRLLIAKLAGVTTLILLTPVLVLAPMWLVSGFSEVEMLEAAWDWVKWQALASWLAVVVAAVSGNLRQFLFGAIALGALIGFALMPSLPFSIWLHRGSSLVRESREIAIVVLCLIGGVVVLAKAYRAGNMRDARAALQLTAIFLVITRLWWPWTIFAGWPPRQVNAFAPATTVEVLTPRFDGKFATVFPWRIGYGLDRASIALQHASGKLSWPEGREQRVGFSSELTGELLRRVALRLTDTSPIVWNLPTTVYEPQLQAWRDQPAKFEGTAFLAAMRPHVVGECALDENAEFRRGAAVLRILATFQTGGDSQFFVMIEERDAWRAWRDGSFLADTRSPEWKRNSMEEVYVMIRPDNSVMRLNASSGLTVVRHGILRSVALLEYRGRMPPPGTRLAKLRFDILDRFTKAVRVDRLPLETAPSP